MSGFIVVISLLGGLGLFLVGMNLASEALQKFAANKVKNILALLTRSPLLGVGIGAAVTALLQSSSATTVLLVSFVSAGFVSLANSIGVIMGSAIGATLTVQLIAFKITEYALLMVAVGALLYIFAPKYKHKNLGQVILGFGLLFFGMFIMSESMMPLRESPLFIELIAGLTGHTLMAVFVGALVTAVIQSSAATLAITMSLAIAGVVDFATAVPIMLGANVGTTSTTLLSALAASKEAKRAALAHFFFRVIGVLLFLPFIGIFTDMVALTSGDAARQIANSHTLFNVIATFVLLPFSSKMADLLTWLMPIDEEERETEVKYLDTSSLDVPDVALWQTKNEMLRLSRIIDNKMLARILDVLEKGGEDAKGQIAAEEKKVDTLYVAISNYLTGLVQRNLTEEQSEKQVQYLNISNDLEHLGDVIYGTSRLSEKALMERVNFNSEDLNDLAHMHAIVRENFQKVIQALEEEDYDTAAEVLRRQPEVSRLEKDIRYNHFMRISQSNHESIEGSSIYLDILNNFQRMNLHIINMAQATLGIV